MSNNSVDAKEDALEEALKNTKYENQLKIKTDAETYKNDF